MHIVITLQKEDKVILLIQTLHSDNNYAVTKKFNYWLQVLFEVLIIEINEFYRMSIVDEF